MHMARRTKLDAQKTRTQIIDAAEILFYEKGVSNTSLNDIASHAGVTRGAIYWHFKNKIDLFHAMHIRVALPLENMQSETLGQPDPIVSLRDFWIRSLLQVATDDRRRRVVEILFRKCEYVEEFEDAAERIQEWSKLIILKMTGIFSEARDKNILQDNITPEIAALSTYSMITGVMYSWMVCPDINNITYQMPEIIAAFFRSLHRPTIELPLRQSVVIESRGFRRVRV
ncbi:TetR family transcriptional regulator [Telmatospirillum sp.]|uniref:TetR family transcriptional regulator n=1 Tax=Telmatospirillum sp. TaxID=2079197 RepID=UPI002847394C|nr:TetR family transcriptional regulator [Telmatospirillum sp.]MDR3440870.1 TetR family transcriptional regulator [Telmatospirillum sp.]